MKDHQSWQIIKTLGIHAFFWILYVLSEYFANLMHIQATGHFQFLLSTLLSLPVLLFSSYFIAWYVVPRYLKTNKWALFLFWILAVGFFVFYGRIKWLELISYLENNHYYRIPPSKVIKNVIRDYAIIALAVCIYIIGDYRNKQKLNEALIKAKAEAEIKLLKGQLHPHFLFNSLNNIYSLALMKSDHTADSILMLTELLDYLVYKANMDMVPLGKELQLLQNYIGLEELRYGEKLKLTADIDVSTSEIMVAPLLLLPFAENCFKHGGVGKEGLFTIDLQLQVRGDKLLFHIVNSKKRGKKETAHQGGIGLQNIAQRLHLIYPGRHQLSIDNQADSYAVKLEIILKSEEI